MGRVKSKYPKGLFVFRARKSNVKGEKALYLQYIINSATVAQTSGFFIKEMDWDRKGQFVKATNPIAHTLNVQLRLQRDRVDKQIMAYEGYLTVDIVRKMLKGEFEMKSDPRKIDFIQYAEAYNKQRYETQRIAYSTYYNGDRYIKKFQRFIAERTGESLLSISELNIGLIDRYKARCLKKGNSKEGINKMLTPLILTAQYAVDNNLISPQIATSIKNSYFDLKERQYKSEVIDNQVHYLTEKQMQQFVRMYCLVKFNRTREIMDFFLFAFHACGLRISDVVTLEWAHIDWENKELSKNLVKCKVPHTIPLTDAAMNILERWREMNRNGRFVFDLLDSTFNVGDAELLDKTIKSKNRSIQTSLNAIGEKMQLPFSLTMHVARHSFAVMALSRGVTVHMISKLLGHSSIITTEKVYAEFLQDTITHEVRTKLSFQFGR